MSEKLSALKAECNMELISLPGIFAILNWQYLLINSQDFIKA